MEFGGGGNTVIGQLPNLESGTDWSRSDLSERGNTHGTDLTYMGQTLHVREGAYPSVPQKRRE